MNKQPHILDTTLRDGTQGENISVTLKDKVRIAEKLDKLGVRYIDQLVHSGHQPGNHL